jgi:TonB family protein
MIALRAIVGALAVTLPALAAAQNGQGANARPDTTAPPPPGPTAVGSGGPVLLNRVEATYTTKARQAGITGEVWLEVSVRADGTVGSILVDRSLDTMYGLDQQAIDAVRHWSFAPRPGGSQAVYPPMKVIISFHLGGAAVAPPAQTEPFGLGAAKPGQADLVLPKIKTQVSPVYTTAAMRQRIAGEVKADAVVLPDGTVGQARITKSLDAASGLDDQALGALRTWTFEPGTLRGQPVPVVVQVVLTFRLQ